MELLLIAQAVLCRVSIAGPAPPRSLRAALPISVLGRPAVPPVKTKPLSIWWRAIFRAQCLTPEDYKIYSEVLGTEAAFAMACELARLPDTEVLED